MAADPNLSIEISVRHFPGEEEPTSTAAWISLGTVLLFLVAIMVYSLHLTAPDPLQEYANFVQEHPVSSVADHVAIARFCAGFPQLARQQEANLRKASELDARAPVLREELMRIFRERRAAASSPAQHVAVAEWCRSFGLTSQAAEQHRAALALDADYAPAKKGLADLGK